MPNNRFAFFNGEIVPIEQAQVSVMTNALNYGTGCFEGIRGYWNPDHQQLYVFCLREHGAPPSLGPYLDDEITLQH